MAGLDLEAIKARRIACGKAASALYFARPCLEDIDGLVAEVERLTAVLAGLLAEFDDIDAECGEPRLTVQEYYRAVVEQRIESLGEVAE